MERQGPSDIPYLLTLKHVTNEPIYTTENRLQKYNIRLVVGKGERVEEG